ncbi:pyridoxal-phosphate dependent enzyme [Thiotrichales bacterium 19X7-9]|nr:pyridoxal-phosphate dependent enzyme [Thiotrichales bacterium 19X7-9]
MTSNINWIKSAIKTLQADAQRSAETNLLKIRLPALSNITIYLKNESNHKTGSLKHRLARSLFIRALLQGEITKDSTIIEASSGNTAISEAYYAQLLNLPYIAVMVKTTSQQKINRIQKLGGQCHLIDNNQSDVEVAKALAKKTNGYFINQFESAKKVFGISYSDNVGQSILEQMEFEAFSTPTWFICGTGTGCTIQAFTECILKNNLNTRLCVVDPEFSAYYDYYLDHTCKISVDRTSRIEGIGRRQVATSFNASCISRMLKIPDAASIASIRFIQEIIGLKVGGSTGTNLYGAFLLANEMQTQGASGSIVTLCCDAGTLYENTYFDDDWLKKEQLDIQPYYQQIEHFYNTGKWQSHHTVQDSWLDKK